MSARPSAKPRPSRHKVAVLTWIAIYPTITLFSWLFGRLRPLGGLPLPLRTLLLTALLVPAMVFILLPMLTRLFTPWLQAGHDHPTAVPVSPEARQLRDPPAPTCRVDFPADPSARMTATQTGTGSPS